MAQNINVVVLTGNLTKDPEMRATTGGTDVATLRLAVNGRRKDSNGEWVDDPNYFDVTAFGGQARACGEHLSKGRPIAVHGRLDWREWEAKDGGKRQAIQVIAQDVQFLGEKKRSGSGGDSGDVAPVGEGGEYKTPDDDIPF